MQTLMTTRFSMLEKRWNVENLGGEICVAGYDIFGQWCRFILNISQNQFSLASLSTNRSDSDCGTFKGFRQADNIIALCFLLRVVSKKSPVVMLHSNKNYSGFNFWQCIAWSPRSSRPSLAWHRYGVQGSRRSEQSVDRVVKPWTNNWATMKWAGSNLNCRICVRLDPVSMIQDRVSRICYGIITRRTPTRAWRLSSCT